MKCYCCTKVKFSLNSVLVKNQMKKKISPKRRSFCYLVEYYYRSINDKYRMKLTLLTTITKNARNYFFTHKSYFVLKKGKLILLIYIFYSTWKIFSISIIQILCGYSCRERKSKWSSHQHFRH